MNDNTGIGPPDGPRRRRVANFNPGYPNLPLGPSPKFASLFRAYAKIASFGKEAYEAVRSAVVYVKENIGPAIAEATRAAFRRIRQWAVENSRLSTALVFVFFAVVPGYVIAFVLGAFLRILMGWLGFSALGPVAGTAAAWFQTTFGNVGARSVFAVIQSAAMGGYGAIVVNGMVRIGGVIGGLAVGLWSKRR